LLGPHGRGDGVQHDADRLCHLVKKSQVNVTELEEAGEFDRRLDVAFEQHRKANNTDWRRTSQTGVDAKIIAGHIARENPLAFTRALAYQALPDFEVPWDIISVNGVSGQELQHRRFLDLIRYIEGPVLGSDQRRQLRKQELGYGQQVALALHHSSKFRDVGLQPILFIVLTGRGGEVQDHLIDVVLQRRNFALRLHGDGTGQVAFGHGRRHLGDGAHLSG